MLSIHHVWKSYGIEPILKDITFSVQAGEHAGLIGPNGCGKSTLLRIIAGEETADRGQALRHPADLRVGYVPQGLAFPAGITLETLFNSEAEDRTEDDLRALAQTLARDPHDRAAQEAYDCILQRLQTGSERQNRSGHMLRTFGLDAIPQDTPVEHLSGGQKTRLALLLGILERPDFLLLDEPTNHLDDEMLAWLEDWLKGYSGGCLVVSHDRSFLDAVADRVLYLDGKTHTLRAYAGNYSDFQRQFDGELDRHWAQYKDQTAEIRRMKQDIAHTKQQSLRVELSTTPRQPFVRRIAKLVAKKAKSREKKLERYLASDEIVEKPQESWRMKMDWEDAQVSGKDVLRMENVSIGYGAERPLLSGINFTIRRGERIALTGPNGCGKTTLLRTACGMIPVLEGRVYTGAQVRFGLMAQEQETLDGERSALEIIRAITNRSDTEVRTFLHKYLFKGDEPLMPAASLSYGERARLTLAALVAEGCNFLLLDEPVNHLDIPSRDQFEQAIRSFEGTILAVVHDRYFVERFATRVMRIDNRGLRDFGP